MQEMQGTSQLDHPVKNRQSPALTGEILGPVESSSIFAATMCSPSWAGACFLIAA